MSRRKTIGLLLSISFGLSLLGGGISCGDEETRIEAREIAGGGNQYMVCATKRYDANANSYLELSGPPLCMTADSIKNPNALQEQGVALKSLTTYDVDKVRLLGMDLLDIVEGNDRLLAVDQVKAHYEMVATSFGEIFNKTSFLLRNRRAGEKCLGAPFGDFLKWQDFYSGNCLVFTVYAINGQDSYWPTLDWLRKGQGSLLEGSFCTGAHAIEQRNGRVTQVNQYLFCQPDLECRKVNATDLNYQCVAPQPECTEGNCGTPSL
jgi:hypothetical protein